MLPHSAVRWPPARSRCASSAVVVLLPLVPVTQTVRASGRSANHSAVPPMIIVPRSRAATASGRYGLMPGDLITTSKAASRSAVASVSTRKRASPSERTSSASPGEQKSVSSPAASPSESPFPNPGRFPTVAGWSSRARSARYAARPSRPQPQSATRLPSSCEMRTQLLPERRRNAVDSTLAELIARLDVVDHQQRSDVEFPRVQLRQDLARTAFDDRVLLPLRAPRQRGHRRARPAAIPDERGKTAARANVSLDVEHPVVAISLIKTKTLHLSCTNND